MSLGNVLVGTKNAHHPAFAIVQGNLVGVDPGLLAIRLVLRLDDVKFGGVRRHHPAVALPVVFGFVLRPGQVVVCLADNLLGRFKPRGGCKITIATEVNGVSVFPEDELGDGVEDKLQHLL